MNREIVSETTYLLWLAHASTTSSTTIVIAGVHMAFSEQIDLRPKPQTNTPTASHQWRQTMALHHGVI